MSDMREVWDISKISCFVLSFLPHFICNETLFQICFHTLCCANDKSAVRQAKTTTDIHDVRDFNPGQWDKSLRLNQINHSTFMLLQLSVITEKYDRIIVIYYYNKVISVLDIILSFSISPAKEEFMIEGR